MFRDASKFVVTGGHFTTIENASALDPVSTVLLPQVAQGAIFDSAEQYPPGKCHPGTRQKIIEQITRWIDDPTTTKHILWLYGPAGSGKSALAHSICEHLRESHSERYGVSFFFARGSTDRGNGLKLFTTLSYQLALHFPSMRSELNKLLSRDPSLPSKSMEIQLLLLIIQPLLRCAIQQPQVPVLIIDGLDECGNDNRVDTQRNIIALITKCLVEYKLPVRFLIASRPEFWIRDAFETSPLPRITSTLSLRDDLDADKDIKLYLIDGFEKIRMENKRIVGSVVAPWPATDIIDRFVYEASGQYVYASTVLKFVGKFSQFHDPQEQLRIVTSSGPRRASAFSELDRLYETIISAYPRWPYMKRVLGGILVDANSTVIEIILGVDSTEVMLVLDALSPLIDVKRPGPLSEHELLLEPIFGSLSSGQDDISLCHLSFREFLEDETRSGQFHIDVQEIHEEISQAFFGIIHHNLDRRYATEPHLSLNIGLTTYRRMMFVMGYQCTSYMEFDTLYPLITSMAQRLLVVNPDQDIDLIECFIGHIHNIMEMLVTIFIQSLEPTHDEDYEQKLASLLDAVQELRDAISFIEQRCIHQWSSYSESRVTPTLVYLDEVYNGKDATIDELFVIPGHTTADVLSTLHQHRHIINIVYSHTPPRGWSLRILKSEQGKDTDEGWRTQGEWRHQRILLAHQHLEKTLNDSFQEENPYHDLGQFFMSRNLSDVYTREYFQDPPNLSILALMTDFSAWSDLTFLQPRTWYYWVGKFITPVLSWFNRQLTDPNTLRLLNDHDKTLVTKMKTTMKQIFEHNFLPNFRGSYYSELYVSTWTTNNPRSIRIQVFPLPQNLFREEETPCVSYEDLYSCYWRPFHDEVFGKTSSTAESPIPFTINPVDWHPFLATRLLNALVKVLYRRINSNFDVDNVNEVTEKAFAYIVECLPYAQTTQQNLDSLRAIAYLFPKASLEWNPPVQFWYLSVEFLRRYDRSILSEEELNLFESWMYGMGSYMKRYHPATVEEASSVSS